MARAGPEKAGKSRPDLLRSRTIRFSSGDFLNSFAMKARAGPYSDCEFYYPKKNKNKKKKEKCCAHMIKCLLTELGGPDGKIFRQIFSRPALPLSQ